MLGISKSEHTIYSYILISVLACTPKFLYATDKLVDTITTEILKDPTLPQNYLSSVNQAAPNTVQPKDNTESLRLNAIFLGENRKIAIINGKILREGDSFGENKIKNIHESSVLVLVPGANNSIEELVMRLPPTIIKGKEIIKDKE